MRAKDCKCEDSQGAIREERGRQGMYGCGRRGRECVGACGEGAEGGGGGQGMTTTTLAPEWVAG